MRELKKENIRSEMAKVGIDTDYAIALVTGYSYPYVWRIFDSDEEQPLEKFLKVCSYVLFARKMFPYFSLAKEYLDVKELKALTKEDIQAVVADTGLPLSYVKKAVKTGFLTAHGSRMIRTWLFIRWNDPLGDKKGMKKRELMFGEWNDTLKQFHATEDPVMKKLLLTKAINLAEEYGFSAQEYKT